MEITLFLKQLFGQVEQGDIVVWTKQNKRSAWLTIEELDDVENLVGKVTNFQDVYFGVGIRDRNKAIEEAKVKKPNKKVTLEHIRGGETSITGIPGIWADIDILHPIAHKSECLPKSVDEAMELLKRYPLPPTYIIDSGYGLQVYWLFKEPWMFDHDKERKEAIEYCKSFYQTMSKLAEEKGWELDNVQDIARVFRLPGTLNHKDRSSVKEVKILEYNPEILYNPSELEGYFLVSEKPAQLSASSLPSTQPSPLTNSSNNQTAPKVDQIADADVIKSKCSWLKHCFDDAQTLTEPEWYSMLTVIGRCRNGIKEAHNWSSPYPDYRYEETEEKLRGAVFAARSGPITCQTVAQKHGDSWCSQCEYKGKVRSPINLSKPEKNITANKVNSVKEITSVIKPLTENKKTPLETAQTCSSPLRIPSTYRMEETGLYKKGNNGVEVSVTYCPILVIGLTQDIDGQNENILLSWPWMGKKRYLQVPRSVINNQNKLSTFNNPGYPITSSNARNMVDFFGEFMALNEQFLPVYTMTNRLGWHELKDEPGFFSGKEYITEEKEYVIGMDAGEHFSQSNVPLVFDAASGEGVGIVKSISKNGTMKGWLAAIEPIKSYPLVQLGLYTAFVPVMLDILDCPNFIVDFSNRTSTGKSTVQRIASSVVGNPKENSSNSYLHTWDVTLVWVERASATINHFPLILDDTKRAKKESDIAKILYLITNGKGRGRGTKQGIAEMKTWRTVLISSGEMPITGFTEDGGTRGRVLPIRGIPFGDARGETGRIVKRLNTDISENYGHAYPLFVNWVIKHKPWWSEWKTAYQQFANQYSMNQNHVQGRLSDYLAAIRITAKLVHEAFSDMGHALPWDFVDHFDGIWESILKDTKDPLQEEEALKEVVSWVNCNKENFLSNSNYSTKKPKEGWYGRIDSEGIGIRTTLLDTHLKQLGFNPKDMKELWANRRWLDVEGGRFTKKVRFGNAEIVRVVYIKSEVIKKYCS